MRGSPIVKVKAERRWCGAVIMVGISNMFLNRIKTRGGGMQR